MIVKIAVEEVDTIENQSTANSALILENTVKSVNDFYALFQVKSTAEGRKQDLLRAMLVFACSGLDAVIKQLIKDSLAGVIDADQGARQEMVKYVSRSVLQKGIGNEPEQNIRQINTDRLADLLISDNPKRDIVSMHVRNLCSDSLQSKDQILKIASSFAITSDAIMGDPDTIRTAFMVRNQIIHEMDVDLSDDRNRRERTEDVIKKYCEEILLVGKKFIAVVSGKLDRAEKEAGDER
ncbi:MAG: hypothetical protein LBG75_03470 [Candidatus Nomurabacteria bacterium]|jgi:hypothetical protein|nr:hypothetical protein [Candidatus Nomurabacteria bacterium]